MPRWGRNRFFAANAQMTRNVVEAAIVCGVRQLVLISSDMVYGVPPGRPLRESDPPRPIGPYGRSKLLSEQICRSAQERGVTVTVLRPRLIIGPGRLGVLTRLFDRIAAGRSVPMLGSGRNRYQMASVEDVASACVLAVERGAAGVFNIGSEGSPPVRELLSCLIERAGSSSKLTTLPVGPALAALRTLHLVRCSPLSPEQFGIAATDYVLDTTQAREQLGWAPRDSDSEMLWAAYEAYLGWRDRFGAGSPQ
jgi:dTDP-glucose 4,6-dehydratase